MISCLSVNPGRYVLHNAVGLQSYQAVGRSLYEPICRVGDMNQ